MYTVVFTIFNNQYSFVNVSLICEIHNKDTIDRHNKNQNKTVA